MKQTFKKKPEYLDTIVVEDNSQSIKEVYELACVKSGNISFNDDGERIITVESDGNNLEITTGMVVFKDKKSGKLITMPKEKLLQFYDVINPATLNENEEK